MASQSTLGASALSKGGVFVVYLSVQLGALLLASASQRQPTRYLNSTAVTLSELIKVAISLIGIAATERLMLRGLLRAAHQTLLGQPQQLLKVAVPALLYTVQNNVIYASLAHIDSVTFQITYQLKLVSSLLAARLLLKKPVARTKWLSVALLTLGVVFVQLSLQDDAAAAAADAAESDDESPVDAAASAAAAAAARRSRAKGIVGVLVACGCSGLAGAAMELLLKEDSQSLPRRNLQVPDPQRPRSTPGSATCPAALSPCATRRQVRRGGAESSRNPSPPVLALTPRLRHSIPAPLSCPLRLFVGLRGISALYCVPHALFRLGASQVERILPGAEPRPQLFS